MSASHATQIVEGYLARLEAELGSAPADRRRELLADVRGHIMEARVGLEQETDADLLNILDRLGEPAELAREATETSAVQMVASDSRYPATTWGWIEVAAILLMILAWPAGIILVWLSRFWGIRDKAIAAALGAVPFSLGFPLFAPLIGPVLGPLLERMGPSAPLLLGSLGLLNVAAAIYLAVRLWRRSERSLSSTRPVAHG